MCKALVSVIAPCYNGEKWISRLLDSVLAQTYTNIEFIIINDGSTDGSEKIIFDYKEKFIDRGFKFLYHNQENEGLGGAINSGLKLFSGNYLCWVDADDYLEPESIEERVRFLETHSEYAVVTSDAYLREYDNLDHVSGLISDGKIHLYEENQFEHLLDEKGIFCSGCHMVRVSEFLKVNPERNIYPARRGQNWQMLLPLYYGHKVYFMQKPLYNYISYPSSMSKTKKVKEDMLYRYEEHENILIHTLQMIEENQNADLSKYFIFVKHKYCRLRMAVALFYEDYELFDQVFMEKKERDLSRKDYSYLLRRKIKIINKLCVNWRKHKKHHS